MKWSTIAAVAATGLAGSGKSMSTSASVTSVTSTPSRAGAASSTIHAWPIHSWPPRGHHAQPTEQKKRSAANAESPPRTAAAQAETEPYTDAETGITFQQYPSTDGVQFRVALPALTAPGQPYDILLQVEAPKSLGWVGWSWAGQMTYSPLTILWANGDEVVHSSRMAFGYQPPTPYADATYQVLKGTGVRGDTMKFTAVCKGCSSWTDFTGEPFTVDASQEARFAYAFAEAPVASPADNTSSFSIHDGVGHWYHDLPAAQSASFDIWVAQNTVANNGTGKPAHLGVGAGLGVAGLNKKEEAKPAKLNAGLGLGVAGLDKKEEIKPAKLNVGAGLGVAGLKRDHESKPAGANVGLGLGVAGLDKKDEAKPAKLNVGAGLGVAGLDKKEESKPAKLNVGAGLGVAGLKRESAPFRFMERLQRDLEQDRAL
ncbi:hypothetical protein PG991_016261 [Apiospora marii]|uniref:Cellobiose dehydrogenase-like cytochrome domain-containing protein n=1 Tax=Apiospora marii TaxID=335849 RepID=A0ABR1QZU0_9PEZI